jgi:hypothetical protein
MSMTAFFRTAPLRRLTKPLAALALAGLFAGPALAREQAAPARRRRLLPPVARLLRRRGGPPGTVESG